ATIRRIRRSHLRIAASPIPEAAAQQPGFFVRDRRLRATGFSSIYFLYGGAKSELAPQEDQGVVIASSTPAPNATLQQKLLYSRQIHETFVKHPETAHVFQLDVPGQSIAGMVLKPWDERTKTSNQLQPMIQGEVAQKVAGAQV